VSTYHCSFVKRLQHTRSDDRRVLLALLGRLEYYRAAAIVSLLCLGNGGAEGRRGVRKENSACQRARTNLMLSATLEPPSVSSP
jgi:hypothetical protein